MNELAIGIFCVLAILVLSQTPFVLAFVSLLHSSRSGDISDESLSKAAVILALRGADPFLGDCIRALLNQNYPQYNLHIVVDSQEDPAWNIVKEAIAGEGATHVQVSPLVLPYKTCSLKCSSLVQAISALDDSYDVVALVDADVIAPPNWLRELVAPLADKQIGASTGNRWYMPQTGQWGSLVRYLYNVSSTVTMYVYNYAWGGSMAMKLSVLRESRLLETWTHGVSVDAPVRRALHKIGLKVKFIPTLMMLNREECDLPGCLRFMTRQLVMPRLYHPRWVLFAVQVFTPALALVLAIAVLPFALVNGNFAAAAWAGGGFVGYILAMAVLVALLNQGVRRVIQMRGELITPVSILMMAKILVAIVLTQLVSAVAMVSAILTRTVEWRGITYQIKEPWNIQLIEYHPYRIFNQPISNKDSL